MKKKTIAEHMVDILNEEDEIQVDIGRPWLWVECLERSKMDKSKGSKRLGSRVMDALDRSHMFERSYVKYGQSVRMFILKEEYRINKYDKGGK